MPLLVALVGCNPPISINQPPTVNIYTPSSGDSFTLGETIAISVEITDPNGDLLYLEVYSDVDGAFYQVQSLENQLLSINFTPQTTGVHVLVAKATDGEESAGETVRVIVSMPTETTAPETSTTTTGTS